MGQRIVSLLPSATELLCEIGLRDALVGVTHECDWPPDVRSLPKVTRTLIPTDASSAEIDRLVRERLSGQRALYSLDESRLAELRPTLIVTQALCDVCAVAEAEVEAAACTLPGRPRVLNLEPTTLGEVLDSLEQVAEAAGIAEQGRAARARLQARVDAVRQRSEPLADRPRVVVLEWLDPPFSAGHWVPEIVRLAGGDEAIGGGGERSRTLSWEEVAAAAPEAIIISCCGYTVERTLEDLPLLWRQPAILDTPAAPAGRVFVLDGSAYLSRPGPRLVEALEIIAHALHPATHPLPPGLPAAMRTAPETHRR
ncbi:MAG: ABC transporter substrate-binding protein [Planctomyces sp.]|nr:ABC transporter substrate-binding protein [Planctomyces sp.]